MGKGREVEERRKRNTQSSRR
jgi:hypothetical protein